jgi:hypothetical protein
VLFRQFKPSSNNPRGRLPLVDPHKVAEADVRMLFSTFTKWEIGWLYSGMAFRMAFDMGIHLPSDKLQAFVKSLSAEDIEIRKRLFWSCYTWDKTISIYLGRMPNFLPDTDGVPLNFSKPIIHQPRFLCPF